MGNAITSFPLRFFGNHQLVDLFTFSSGSGSLRSLIETPGFLMKIP